MTTIRRFYLLRYYLKYYARHVSIKLTTKINILPLLSQITLIFRINVIILKDCFAKVSSLFFVFIMKSLLNINVRFWTLTVLSLRSQCRIFCTSFKNKYVLYTYIYKELHAKTNEEKKIIHFKKFKLNLFDLICYLVIEIEIGKPYTKNKRMGFFLFLFFLFPL